MCGRRHVAEQSAIDTSFDVRTDATTRIRTHTLPLWANTTGGCGARHCPTVPHSNFWSVPGTPIFTTGRNSESSTSGATPSSPASRVASPGARAARRRRAGGIPRRRLHHRRLHGVSREPDRSEVDDQHRGEYTAGLRIGWTSPLSASDASTAETPTRLWPHLGSLSRLLRPVRDLHWICRRLPALRPRR